MMMKKREYLLFGYSIYILSCIFLESALNQYGILLRLMKYSGIGVVGCISLFTANVHKRLAVIASVFLALSFFNCLFFAGGTGLLEILFISICCAVSGCEIEKILKCNVISLILGHLCVIGLCIVGVLPDDVSSRVFGNYMGSFFEGEYNRHRMGFLTSNQVPLFLMIIYLLVIAYKKDRVPLWFHAIVQVLNYICFKMFGSRVSFILIVFTLAYYILIKLYKMKRVRAIPFRWIAFPVCALISFISGYLYNPNMTIWAVANQIFYNRLRWNNNAIMTYRLTLFGKGLTAGTATGINGENIIDNGYVLIYVQRGLILSVFIVFVWMYVTYRAEKLKEKYIFMPLVIISLASLIDNHLSSYKMIPFFALFFILCCEKCDRADIRCFSKSKKVRNVRLGD